MVLYLWNATVRTLIPRSAATSFMTLPPGDQPYDLGRPRGHPVAPAKSGHGACPCGLPAAGTEGDAGSPAARTAARSSPPVEERRTQPDAPRAGACGTISTYTLRLVRSPTDPARPDGFDPLLSAVDFSFKVECPSDFDCKPERVCPPEVLPEPEIDYLAKDYASFRRLMLDRMSALMPDWRERNPADLGVALVEVLAYVADHLSYRQDAIATEAYLGTARRRVSVRRHARLVDYRMHDGCNGRTWLHVRLDEANAPGTGLRLPQVDPTGLRTRFLTRCVDGNQVAAGDLHARAGAVAARRLRADGRRRALPRAQRNGVLHLGRSAVLPAEGRHQGNAER